MRLRDLRLGSRLATPRGGCFIVVLGSIALWAMILSVAL